MDFDFILFWVLGTFCLTGLVVTWKRMRLACPGWLVLYLAILLLLVAGWWWAQPVILYVATGIWLCLVLLPAGIGARFHRCFLRQEYAAAGRLARIVRCLHPADGWRELPEIVQALALAQQGDLTAASQTLHRFQDVKSMIGLTAMVSLYRITNRWEELLAWGAQHPAEIQRHPPLLLALLRARGETGDVRGLVQLYDQNRFRIAKLASRVDRDLCRLMLFAFCGQRPAVERLYAGSLAALPAPMRAFWLATADLQAGAGETAKPQFEALLPAADPLMRGAIQRRLARLALPPEPLDPSAETLLAEASREHGQEETFAGRRSLFSKQARATQLLIVLNLAMFAVECYWGGSTNGWVLYRLGALIPQVVAEGEWWRLATAIFLHFGLLHLAMNMAALALFGPFVEFALGFRRWLLVYLLSGIGSMAMVAFFDFRSDTMSLTVGASGCIMGLVGATGALMLRGWLREKAHVAKRGLVGMLVIVALQVVFDSVTPHVSMTAHLWGALLGCLVTLLLQDRLRSPHPPHPGEGETAQ